MIFFGTGHRRMQRVPGRRVVKIRNRDEVVATLLLNDAVRPSRFMTPPAAMSSALVPVAKDRFESQARDEDTSSQPAAESAASVPASAAKAQEPSKKLGISKRKSSLPLPVEKTALLKKKPELRPARPVSKNTSSRATAASDTKPTKNPLLSKKKPEIRSALRTPKSKVTGSVGMGDTELPKTLQETSKRTDTMDTASTLPRHNTFNSMVDDSDHTPLTSPEMPPSKPPIEVEDTPRLDTGMEHSTALALIPRRTTLTDEASSLPDRGAFSHSNDGSPFSSSNPSMENLLARLPKRPPTPPLPREGLYIDATSLRQRLANEYGIHFYPFRYRGEKAKSLNALLKGRSKDDANQLYQMLRKQGKHNIILQANDRSLKLSTIAALQDKLGYKIPVLDFDTVDDMDPYSPKLYNLIQDRYHDLRQEAAVPAKAPLVLYLKNVNSHTLNSFAIERNVTKYLFNKDRKIRLILDASPGMRPYTDALLYNTKRFDEYWIKSVKPLDWSLKLGQSLERERLEGKYHYTLSSAQLNRVLFMLVRETGGSPSRASIMETLDSLGAFLKAREQGSKRHKGKLSSTPKAEQALMKSGQKKLSVKSIEDEDLLAFFDKQGLLHSNDRTRFSFELKNDLSHLVGLESGKEILDILGQHVAYSGLSKHVLAGQPLVTNLLLYGPPGVGKTMYAEGAAKEWEKRAGMPVTFIRRKGSDFSAKQHYGESAAEVQSFISAIEKSPTPLVVAFVDEADGIYNRKHADTSNSTVATDMTSATETLLVGLQDLINKTDKNVLLIFATNLPENLDDSLKSRMDYKVKVDIPDEAKQRQILVNKLKAANLACDDETLNHVIGVAKKANYSGRELDSFVKRMQDSAYLSLPDKASLDQRLKRNPKLTVTLPLTKQDVDRAERLGQEEKSEEAAHEELRKSYERRRLKQDDRDLKLREAIPDDELAEHSQTHRREMTQRARTVANQEAVPDSADVRKRAIEEKELDLRERQTNREHNIFVEEMKPATWGFT